MEVVTDIGGEFFNEMYMEHCDLEGIKHQFSAPRSSLQNGVVDRRNRSLVEIGKTLLNDQDQPFMFWAEAINTFATFLIEV